MLEEIVAALGPAAAPIVVIYLLLERTINNRKQNNRKQNNGKQDNPGFNHEANTKLDRIGDRLDDAIDVLNEIKGRLAERAGDRSDG